MASTVPTPRDLYIHDLTLEQRTLVDRYELACSQDTPPPSDAIRRELWHARLNLANAQQMLGLRFDRVLSGEAAL